MGGWSSGPFITSSQHYSVALIYPELNQFLTSLTFSTPILYTITNYMHTVYNYRVTMFSLIITISTTSYMKLFTHHAVTLTYVYTHHNAKLPAGLKNKYFFEKKNLTLTIL